MFKALVILGVLTGSAMAQPLTYSTNPSVGYWGLPSDLGITTYQMPAQQPLPQYQPPAYQQPSGWCGPLRGTPGSQQGC